MTLRIPFIMYLLPLAFLFLDLFSFAFFEQHYIYGLLCLYIVELLHFQNPLLIIMTAIILLIESFFIVGSFMPTIVYVVPLTMLGLLMHNLLYRNWYQKYLLLTLVILAQTFIINPYYFQSQAFPSCTFLKLFVNMILITIFP